MRIDVYNDNLQYVLDGYQHSAHKPSPIYGRLKFCDSFTKS